MNELVMLAFVATCGTTRVLRFAAGLMLSVAIAAWLAGFSDGSDAMRLW